MRLMILLYISLTSTGSYASIQNVQCYGNPSHPPIIYLHGRDSVSSNLASQHAKKTVIKIARDLKFSVATPRSSMKCKGEETLCWNLFNKRSSVQRVMKEIITKSQKCFRKRLNTIYIGFSNAGYFLNRSITHCLLDKNQIVISIGSDGFVPRGTPSLKDCAPQVLMVGNQEKIKEKTQQYYQQLKAHSAKSLFIEFQGGHQIPYKELHQFLKNYKSYPI